MKSTAPRRALPQLGKILAKHHGFNCTVLFAIEPGGRHDQSQPQRQHPRPGAPGNGRPADHRHAFSQSARRADEAHRRLRQERPADHRPADRHARLQLAGELDLRPLRLAQQAVGRRLRPAGAGRDLDQPSRRPRQAEHARRHRPGRSRAIRSSAASRTATSGGPPTSTACACRCPATASRWCWARCWKA